MSVHSGRPDKSTSVHISVHLPPRWATTPVHSERPDKSTMVVHPRPRWATTSAPEGVQFAFRWPSNSSAPMGCHSPMWLPTMRASTPPPAMCGRPPVACGCPRSSPRLAPLKGSNVVPVSITSRGRAAARNWWYPAKRVDARRPPAFCPPFKGDYAPPPAHPSTRYGQQQKTPTPKGVRAARFRGVKPKGLCGVHPTPLDPFPYRLCRYVLLKRPQSAKTLKGLSGGQRLSG